VTARASNCQEIMRSMADLVGFFEGCCTSRTVWKIGVEDEMFVFRRSDLRPAGYAGENSLASVVDALIRDFQWMPLLDGGNRVGAEAPSGAIVTTEAGRHLEISGPPLPSVHEVDHDLAQCRQQVESACRGVGLAILEMGFQPKWSRDDTPLVQSGRSQILSEYLSTRGRLGLDMLLRTCALQASFDYSDESDAVAKMRISLAVQPIVTALFSSSPFLDGQLSGYKSYRAHVWQETDDDRTGGLPFVFDPDFGFERYCSYVLDVPMYFVYRNQSYIDVRGQSFRDFMKCRLPALPGEPATMGDWVNHLATIFPDVRLRNLLEMRGADGGAIGQLSALAAFWTGLLYDEAALRLAADCIRDWTPGEIEALRAVVPRDGLAATFRGEPLARTAKTMLEIAARGLQNRAQSMGIPSEARYLDRLFEAADAGISPADQMISAFNGEWSGDIDRIFRGALSDVAR
jgi:glutamate--cysteine ligase